MKFVMTCFYVSFMSCGNNELELVTFCEMGPGSGIAVAVALDFQGGGGGGAKWGSKAR